MPDRILFAGQFNVSFAEEDVRVSILLLLISVTVARILREPETGSVYP
jgi:hypothetical protein